MHKAYIYPISSRANKEINNPYIDNFMTSLDGEFEFVNKSKPSGSGILDIFRYISRIDYVFFHWPENIAERKYGLLQSLLLYFVILICKFKSIRIIFTVHNKISHTKYRFKIKKTITKVLLKNSYRIITHTNDGVDFIKPFSKKSSKIFCFSHPVYDNNTFPDIKKDIDVLIWGNIAPYKGIDHFLNNLKSNKITLDWKIMIAGKASSSEFYNYINNIKSRNVEIINNFIEEADLNILIGRSRIVLFPYHADSVLSSGAFAKTIAFPVEIIGPDCGSFRDFHNFNHVNTFKSEENIIELISNRLSQTILNDKLETEKIIKKYSWKNFGQEFINQL